MAKNPSQMSGDNTDNIRLVNIRIVRRKKNICKAKLMTLKQMEKIEVLLKAYVNFRRVTDLGGTLVAAGNGGGGFRID